jgi:hypothetical protein
MQESLSGPATAGVRAGLRFLCRLVVVGVFHKYLFLEGQNRPILAPWNQAFPAPVSEGFLERGWRGGSRVDVPVKRRWQRHIPSRP